MLEAKDLRAFGNSTGSNHDGTPGTTFILNGATCQLELLLLRKLIVGLGYKINKEEDFYWTEKDELCDLLVETTFPWADYQKL